MAVARLQPEVDETATPTRLRAASHSSAATPATEVLNAPESDHLEIHRNIRVSQQDFQLFLVASESNERPNETLMRAAERYNRKYR